MAAAAVGLAFGAMFFIFSIIALVILCFIAWIWAIVDIVQARNESNWKLIWILIVVLTSIIGVAIYYFVGRKDRIPEKPKRR